MRKYVATLSTVDATWGAMDPNSQHQRWSRWVFRVRGGKTVPLNEVASNAHRWLASLFRTSCGKARVSVEADRGMVVYVIEADVEGVDAHDPAVVVDVTRQLNTFVHKGWGPVAWGVVDEHRILAGDEQNGKPPDQLIVMPNRIEAWE